MLKQQVPACYFPTTVMFIDDNRKYLKDLRLELDDSKFAPKLMSDPQEALDLLQCYQPQPFTTRCLLKNNDYQLDHRNIDLNIPVIHNEIYNPERFAEISTIVIDYAMPHINGLELCEKLKDKPFKKIMLTGEADEVIAVKAFNEGLIDRFIRKDTANFSELVNKAVEELQHQYFIQLSTTIITALVNNNDPFDTAWLRDPKFITMFNELTENQDITEYYLMDTYGSYMFLDFPGKPSWLAVKNADGMQAAFEIAEGSEPPFPPKILDAMKNKEKILFLYAGGFTEDLQECTKSLYPANQLIGETTYYYAYIKDLGTYNAQRKIVSYKEYLEKVK